MGDRLSSLSTTALAAAIASACVVVLAAAFAVGRATAPDHASAATLTPLHVSRGGMPLPRLSDAVPLPALAAAPAKPARVAPARSRPAVPVQHVHRAKPRKAGGPVDITGSG
jgi:hypothetical protein